MGGVVSEVWRRSEVWFHGGDIRPYRHILTPDGSYESTEAKNDTTINASCYGTELLRHG